RVPVRQVLGIAASVDPAFPKLDLTAFADRNPPHAVEDGDLQQEQDNGTDEPAPRGCCERRRLDQTHFSASPCGCTVCRMMSGICASVKAIVIGIVPQPLKFTQKASEKLRQTTSLSRARNRKNTPQRSVSFFQPSLSSWKAAL